MAMITRIDEGNLSVHPALRGQIVIGTIISHLPTTGWIHLELVGPFYTDRDGNQAPVRVWVQEDRVREATVEECNEAFSAMVHCG